MNMNRKRCLLALAAVLFFCSWARAWESSPEEVEFISNNALRYETPHTDWAAPYAGGRLKALYVVGSPHQGMGTLAREVWELMQRFDLEIDIAYHYNFYRPHWFGDDSGEQRVARLIAGRTHDVYIFQGISPEKLPARWETKANLAKAVAEGAGLVLTGAGDHAGKVIAAKQTVDPAPAFLAGVPVKGVFAVGKGRMVTLPARPEIPYDVGWQVKYEYWQEQLGRAVFWAASREPAMALSLGLPGEPVDRKQPAGQSVTLSATGGRSEEATCAVTLRRWDGETTKLHDGKLNAGGKLTLPLPIVRAGRYHVDAIARSPRGVEAWATGTFEVTADTTVDVQVEWNTRFADLLPDAKQSNWKTPWGEVGERIAGRLKSSPAKGQTARVRLMDHTGRILEQVDLAPGKEPLFDFEITPWLPQLVRVEGVVLDKADEVAADYKWFLVTKRRQGRFNFVLWGPVDQTLGEYAYANLRRDGVTAILTHEQPDLAAAAYGMAWVPMTGGHVGLHGGADRWVRLGPPDTWKGWIANRAVRPHGVLAYSLGDEGPVSGAGITPAGMDVYREYLRGVYGDIGNLNKSWDADLADFAAVQLSAPDDSEEKAALEAGNYPRWYDRQAFARANFVQHGVNHRLAMQPFDPHAKIGFEGSGWFARSADPDGVCRKMDMWVPYTGNIDEVIRSIAPREFIRSNWTGYHSDPDGLLSRYWRSIILGADSVWWWMWSAIDPWRGFQAPDFEPFPATREMLDETRIMRDGLGDLLIRSEMQDDGIAMLYSMPSSYAANVAAKRAFRRYEEAHAWWYTTINDMPLMYRYVTDGMLDRGEFKADKYRILILPFALAMSDQTEKAIRVFVRNGGTVIADIRPGIFNGRCKPLEKGRLDDLFGIRGAVNSKPARGDFLVDGKLGEHDIKLDWPDVPVDPSLKTTTGQALGKAGEAPVFIVNRHGKGRAILLNMAMVASAFVGRVTGTGLVGLDSAEELDPKLWAAFNPIFESGGVQPTIRLIQSRRWKVPFVGNARLQRWRNGDMEIFGVYRATGEGVRTIARLPGDRQAFVYNVTAGLTLGEPPVNTHVDPHKGEKWFYFSLTPARASFFAILPGPAPAIEVQPEEPRVRRGERIRLDISLPGAGKSIHALKLRGIGPDGDAVEGWSQVVLAGAKPVTVEIPVAFNDPPGTYRITITDVITRDTEEEIALDVRRF